MSIGSSLTRYALLLVAVPGTLVAQGTVGMMTEERSPPLHYLVEASVIDDDPTAGSSLLSWLRSPNAGVRIRSLFGESTGEGEHPRHGSAGTMSLQKIISGDSTIYVISVDSVSRQVNGTWVFDTTSPGSSERWIWDSMGRPLDPWSDTSVSIGPRGPTIAALLNAAGGVVGLVPPRLSGRAPLSAWADTVESSPSAPARGIPQGSYRAGIFLRIIRAWRLLSTDTLAVEMDMVVSETSPRVLDDGWELQLNSTRHGSVAALVILGDDGAVRSGISVTRRFFRTSWVDHPGESMNVVIEIGRVTAIKRP